MSRIETLRQSTAVAHATRVDSLKDETNRLLEAQSRAEKHLDHIRRMQGSISEDLSKALLPLAEAMAVLTEETRATLEQVVSQSKKGHQEALESVSSVATEARTLLTTLNTRLTSLDAVVKNLDIASKEVEHQARRAGWRAGATAGLVSGLLSVGSVAWLAWQVGLFK